MGSTAGWLSLAGGAIGSYWGPFGAAIGSTIGWGIGNMIDPVKQDGPKMGGPQSSELTYTPASEGQVVPDLLGTTMIAGVIIDEYNNRNEKITQKVETPGGKGGGGGGSTKQVVGYKYYSTWVISLCKGPVDLLTSIYSDNECIWQGNKTIDDAVDGHITISISGFGTIDFYFGNADHDLHTTRNEYYGHVCHAFMKDCFIGNYNRIPIMKFVVTKRPIPVAVDHDMYDYFQKDVVDEGPFDYSPIGAVWTIMTEMAQFPEDRLVGATWSGVAGYISGSDYDNMSCSILFDREATAREYIEQILRGIKVGVRASSDGYMEPVLWRDNGDPQTFNPIRDDMLLEPPTITRQNWIDTYNEVTISYPKRVFENPDYNIAADYRISIAKAEDTANKQIQERSRVVTLNYGIFNTDTTIAKVTALELKYISHPMMTINIKANRSAWIFEPLDDALFSYAPYGISEMPVKILQVTEDDLESGAFNITMQENIDYIGQIGTITPPTSSGSTNSRTVDTLTNVDVVEAPYILTEGYNGVIPLAAKENSTDLGYTFYISVDGGTSYISSIIPEVFQPYGTLVNSLSSSTYTIDDDTELLVDFSNSDVTLIESITRENMLIGYNLAGIKAPDSAIYEIISFENFEAVSTYRYKITGIYRGRFGSEQLDHSVGNEFWFLGAEYFELDNNAAITPGTIRDFKHVVYNNWTSDDISNCTAVTREIEGLSKQPFRPVNFKTDEGYYDPTYTSGNDITTYWSPRIRTEGAGFGDPDSVIDAAPTWEGYFRIRVYVSSILVRTVMGIDAATWTYTNAMNTTDNGTPADIVVFKLSNYREEGGYLYYSDETELSVRKL